MATPGLDQEQYKNSSRNGKILYWMFILFSLLAILVIWFS